LYRCRCIVYCIVYCTCTCVCVLAHCPQLAEAARDVPSARCCR
jgi:hypothetical protein